MELLTAMFGRLVELLSANQRESPSVSPVPRLYSVLTKVLNNDKSKEKAKTVVIIGLAYAARGRGTAIADTILSRKLLC
ncbi:unnamed protein product [Toxocara canis]|uniref:Secreted protein n=1 Tax=Toxocara canis TaxID=6265 RepID=A0A183U2I1_TOXCA|nr:unnamed protein product [Toxocara canis]